MVSAPSLVILIVALFIIPGETSQFDNSPQIMELYNLVRQQPSSAPAPLPDFCRAEVIEPAVDCGCWRYSRLYLGLAEWQGLADMCLELLDGNLDAGRIICRSTDFVREGGGVSIIALNAYFREARRICIFRRPVRPPSIRFHQDTYADRGAMPFDLAVRVNGLRTRQHNILRRFCFVAGYTRGLSRREAQRLCCPRRLWR